MGRAEAHIGRTVSVNGATEHPMVWPVAGRRTGCEMTRSFYTSGASASIILCRPDGRCDTGAVLPELEPLLELDEPKTWFPVPGMYGGSRYWLAESGANAKLVSESWCRVAGGSGQRHQITAGGATLVEDGFV